MYNSISMTGVAATLAKAMGVEPPKHADKPINSLMNLVAKNTKQGRVDRILMYNPDAVAMWLFQKYTTYFDKVLKHTQLTLPLITVMPSVTPVCFGTMYTGATPDVHGIKQYEKPVIQIDTLFDSLLRSGKKAAIVADNKCSMGKIFLNRKMDYFLYDTIEEINNKAIELIQKDEHDFIAVYNGNYDGSCHKTWPESDLSLTALKENISAFDMLAEKVKECWKSHETLISFATDHGIHKNKEGSGSHGTDMPEDLNVLHFYGVI